MLLDPVGRELWLQALRLGKCRPGGLDVSRETGGSGECAPRRRETRPQLHRPPVQGGAFAIASGDEMAERASRLIERLVRVAGTEPQPLGQMVKSFVACAREPMRRADDHMRKGEVGIEPERLGELVKRCSRSPRQ